MKKSYVITLTAAAFAVALAGPVVAFSDDAPRQCGHGHWQHGKAKMEGRLTQLKTDLNLSPAQEASWQTFEQTVREQIASHEQMRAQAKTDQDPMQARIAHMEQRLAGMKAVAKAKSDLYQTLTVDQKTIADGFFQHGKHGPQG